MSSGLTQVAGITAVDDQTGGTFTGGAITNSTIDNSVIGGTTPAAGNFTTVAVASGAAGTPSLTFQNDSDTGIFLTNANSPAITAGGNIRVGVATGGQTIVSNALTSVVVAITSTAGALGQQGSGFQVNGTNDLLPGSCLSSISRFSNNDAPPSFILAKSRGATINTMTVVASGDALGAVNFNGADGSAMRLGGQILGRCFGSAGSNSMPGQIEFKTTPLNSVTPLTALTLRSDQTAVFASTVSATQIAAPNAPKMLATIFNNSGTPVSGGTCFNVAGFTDHGPGDWTVNFTTSAAADRNNCMFFANAFSTSAGAKLACEVVDYTTKSVRITTYAVATGTNTDPDRMYVQAYGFE